MQDIHDIRPPVEIGMDPWILKAVAIGLILVLVLLAAFLLYRYFMKKRREAAVTTLLLPPPLPPDEAALRDLEAITAMMDSMPRLFVFRLTNVMKNYLGRQYGLGIPEMTNQEIVTVLRHLDMNRDDAGNVREFFLATEAITYAGATPDRDRLNKDWGFVRDFVVSHARSRNQSDQEV